MTSPVKGRKPPAKAVSKISQILGGNFILPGESAQQFYEGYAVAIDELGAKTHLQQYLALQIFQSLWWMRRYETQKRASLIAESVKILRNSGLADLNGLDLTEMLEAGRWDEPALLNELQNKDFTPHSLLQKAQDRQQEGLMRIDQSIALKAHTLAQLQKSYEALVNRSVMQERLKLQNDLLKRDLLAIDTPVVKDLKTDAQQLAHETDQWEPKYDER
jgi:hypothetical protein